MKSVLTYILHHCIHCQFHPPWILGGHVFFAWPILSLTVLGHILLQAHLPFSPVNEMKTCKVKNDKKNFVEIQITLVINSSANDC